MKKTVVKQRLLIRLMKMTLYQFILALVFSTVTMANSLNGQGKLDTKVTISMTDVNLNKALSELGKSANVKFSYNSRMVCFDQKVTLNANNEVLSTVLSRVLKPLNISYAIVSNQIILQKDNDEYIDFSSATGQQQKTLSGVVVDVNGLSLPGATVLVKGTRNSVSADMDGKFSIAVDNDANVLVVSYIGFDTLEIPIGTKTDFKIILKESSQSLEEVVVVGYGTQKKVTLTGSVVDVSGKELQKSPNANITASLQGKLPGLVAVQRSGEPGRDDANILIRGNGTTGDNSPLIIIDGVERSQIGRLNPEDIESVSVLKDASAAIYGARAANGVILVTTKKGKIGKPEFSISLNSAFNRPTKIPDMLDSSTFAEVYNEGDFYRKGRPNTGYTPFYSTDAIRKFRDGSDPILYPNTDWIGEVMKNNSLQQRLNMQVTGGTEDVRYLLSFGAITQGGDFKNVPTDFKQFNFRSKIDVNVNKNITIGANISAILTKKEYSIVDNVVNFTNLLIGNPTLVSRYPNGLIAPGRLGENPLLLNQRGSDRTNDEPIYTTFTASYKVPFIEGLKIDASYNYDLSHQFQKRISLPYTYHEYNVNTTNYDLKQGTGASTVELWDRYSRWTTKLFNYRITYDNTFGNHHVMAMLGQEQQQNTYSYAEAYRRNFVSPAIDQINAGSSDPNDKNNSGNASASAYNNYLGRFNYEFQSKYLFEFSFRNSGSQNFPTSSRYGFFPAIQGGWRISEENFIKNNLPFVNNLKIRATYGEVGNDRVPQYQYLQLFSFGGNYVFGSNDSPGVVSSTLPNTNITWEVSKKTDFGLETSLWDGLLGFDFTYFLEKRTGILAQRNLSIPGVVGFPALPSENIGKVDNRGYEIEVKHRNNFKGLKYGISANMSYVKSNVVFLDETPNPEAPWKSVTGNPVGANLIYKADGIFNTQEELDAYPHQNGTQVGDIKIVDYNNDGVIDSNDQYRFNKTATPEVVFGMTMNFEWHNLDLNLFFQGQTNAYNYDASFASLGNSNFDNTYVARANNRWTIDNPNGTMPRADSFSPGTNTFFMYDATFVRLRSLELGWTVPKKFMSTMGVNSLRFYASAFNLLTWAKEIKWSDPEIAGNSLVYPQLRTINLGVSVKF